MSVISPSKLQVTCRALGIYYNSNGRFDYYDVNNQGLFSKWFNSQGYSIDYLNTELQNNNYNGCSLLKFDNNFPLNPPIIDKNEKQKKIYKIIQYCYNNGKPPKNIQNINNNNQQSQPNINNNLIQIIQENDAKEGYNDGNIVLYEPIINQANILPDFQKIDDALGEYYNAFGNNTYYDNNDNDNSCGKFMKFCIDAEYEEDDIESELGDDIKAEDCSYLDFEDINLFPLQLYIIDVDKRQNKIFKILQYIYKNATFPPLNEHHYDILQIDTALSTYYRSMGVNNYYNKYSRGKFTEYIENNNINPYKLSNDINELKKYVNFDKNFPLKKLNVNVNININNNGRNDRIAQILYYCHIYGTYLQPATLDEWKFIVSKKEIKKTKKIYSKQCLLDKFDDNSLFTALTVGRLNDNYPFAQYLCDTFNRRRLEYYIKCEKNKCGNYDLKERQWSLNNHFIQLLIKQQRINESEIFISSIYSYMYRLCPKFLLKHTTKIRDDIFVVAELFVSACMFIKSLLKQHHATAPFMFDFGIAVAECDLITNNSDAIIPHGLDPDDFKISGASKYYDILGNVAQKLKKNNLVVHSDFDLYTTSGSRLAYAFRNFQSKIRNEYKNNNNNNNIDVDEYLQHYPHKKRFCAMVDRRNYILDTPVHHTKDNASAKEKLLFWNPPSNCDKIPRHHVPESYFNLSSTCYIPSLNYNNGNEQLIINNNLSEKENARMHTITTQVPTNGGLLIFSFHIEAEDQIKCYLWWSMQCIRFLPQDIIDILPRIFNMDYNQNKDFNKNNKQIISLIQRCLYKDYHFENTYNALTGRSKKYLRKYT